MHRTPSRNLVPPHGVGALLLAFALALALAFAATPALAQSGGAGAAPRVAPPVAPPVAPAKKRDRVPGEALYYYNGAMRVDVVMVLDELRVVGPTGSDLALDTARTASDRVVSAKAVGSVTNMVDLTLEKATDPEELFANAAVVAAGLRDAGTTAEVQPVLYSPGAVDRAETKRKSLTPRFSAKLNDGTDLAAFEAQWGVHVVETIAWLPNTYIFAPNAGDLLASLTLANAIYEAGVVEFATPEILSVGVRRLVPNDSLYGQQWHLNNTGSNSSGGTVGWDIRAQNAWDTATGTGVVIAIVDDGLERTHEDLSPNYSAALSIDINGGDSDPSPGSLDFHGTACAGAAAARGNNGIGVAGSAFNATLAGIRLISAPFTDSQAATAMSHQLAGIHISSNSWGPSDDGATLMAPGPLMANALSTAIASGRGGLGRIFTWAAGNGRCEEDDIGADGSANSRYTIAVGASGINGAFSWYSEYGAAMLCNAPSSSGSCGGGDFIAMTTVDRTGTNGYSSGNYTNTFNGTSAATPVVSGVVALMLQANPNLTWRDVQHILVQTSARNQPAGAGWAQNGAGRFFNHAYGFGRVDAAAAVAAAASWVNVPANATPLTANESPGTAIPDNNPTGITRMLPISGDGSFKVEHVEVLVNVPHTYRGDLRFRLTSPSGMVSTLIEDRPGDNGSGFSNWTFMSVAHWGENPNGTWSLNVVDTFNQDIGTLNSWTLTVRGFIAAPVGTPDIRIAPETLNFP